MMTRTIHCRARVSRVGKIHNDGGVKKDAPGFFERAVASAGREGFSDRAGSERHWSFIGFLRGAIGTQPIKSIVVSQSGSHVDLGRERLPWDAPAILGFRKHCSPHPAAEAKSRSARAIRRWVPIRAGGRASAPVHLPHEDAKRTRSR